MRPGPAAYDRGVDDLAELLALAAADAPDAVAILEDVGRSLTWSQVDDEAGRVATGLSDAGVVAGHRVLIALVNRAEFVTAYFGVLRAQAVAVPVNPHATAGELARMMADSGARLAFVDPVSVAAVRSAQAQVGAALEGEETGLETEVLSRAAPTELVTVGVPAAAGERSYDDLLAAEPRPVPPLRDPDKLAVLLYTSGTSGRPRGAMLTHRALLANIEQVARLEPPMMRADDVVLGVLPLFHVYGLNAVLGAAVRSRATLVLQERFDPAGTLDVISRHSCTVLPLAPAVFPQWLTTDRLGARLASVRLVLSGSAALDPDSIERFTEVTGITLHQGYGLTEAAPVVTSTRRSPGHRLGSVGTTLEGVELRLVDDRGRDVAGGDPGEIWIRGANLFSGYWPDGSGGPDADGWWATGDVGLLDDAGDLVLVDRVKELVLVSGFNVYPHEVEDVIRTTEGVEEAAVIGVADDATGAAVVAYVVAPGIDRATVEAAVRHRCETRLARFKRPTRIAVVDALPLSVTGKVQKGRVRGLERRRALELLG